MLGLVFLSKVLLVAVLVLALWTAVRLLLRMRTPGLSSAAQAARRRSVISSAVTGTAAIVVLVLVVLVPLDERGRLLAAAPALVGAAMIAVSIGVERRWPAPTGEVRTATLRRVRRGSSSRALTWMAVVSGASSLVMLVIAYVTQAPDGRTLLYTWDSGFFEGDSGSLQAGPYPGSRFTWVVVAGLLLVGALTVIGLRAVDSRPALGAGLTREDETAREASRIRVLRGSAFANLATAAGLGLAMGYSWMDIMRQADQGVVPPLIDGVGWSQVSDFGFIPVVLSLAIALLAVKVFFTPGPAMEAAVSVPTTTGSLHA